MNILMPFGAFNGQFGIFCGQYLFFPFWYVQPRKIWQPW
jgi:hypothetical protein